jgi:large subunit ribosomal protein L31e
MERAYTIPLRPVYNRAKRAVRAKRAMKHIREFIARHMKTDPENVKIHVSVNHVVWQRGIQKPPRKIQVVAVEEGGYVWVYTPEERAKLAKAVKKRSTRKKATEEKKTEAPAEKKEEKKEAENAEKETTKKTATKKKTTTKKTSKKAEEKKEEEQPAEVKIEPAEKKE